MIVLNRKVVILLWVCAVLVTLACSIVKSALRHKYINSQKSKKYETKRAIKANFYYMNIIITKLLIDKLFLLDKLVVFSFNINDKNALISFYSQLHCVAHLCSRKSKDVNLWIFIVFCCWTGLSFIFKKIFLWL